MDDTKEIILRRRVAVGTLVLFGVFAIWITLFFHDKDTFEDFIYYMYIGGSVSALYGFYLLIRIISATLKKKSKLLIISVVELLIAILIGVVITFTPFYYHIYKDYAYKRDVIKNYDAESTSIAENSGICQDTAHPWLDEALAKGKQKTIDRLYEINYQSCRQWALGSAQRHFDANRTPSFQKGGGHECRLIALTDYERQNEDNIVTRRAQCLIDLAVFMKETCPCSYLSSNTKKACLEAVGTSPEIRINPRCDD